MKQIGFLLIIGCLIFLYSCSGNETANEISDDADLPVAQSQSETVGEKGMESQDNSEIIIDTEETIKDIYLPNMDVIEALNSNADLPFLLAAKDFEYGDDFTLMGGFGCEVLMKDGIQVCISGWPDVLDPYYITEFWITGSEYSVFGISLSTDSETAVKILEENGYTLIQSEYSTYIYGKSDTVKIALGVLENQTLYEIKISLVTTNIKNVVF